jgi:hypothetical protein
MGERDSLRWSDASLADPEERHKLRASILYHCAALSIDGLRLLALRAQELDAIGEADTVPAPPPSPVELENGSLMYSVRDVRDLVPDAAPTVPGTHEVDQ